MEVCRSADGRMGHGDMWDMSRDMEAKWVRYQMVLRKVV